MDAHIETTDVPRPAQLLGILGAVPFVLLFLISLAEPSQYAEDASIALLAYGAIILSFLGGVQWGLAITGACTAGPVRASYRRLSLSVAPALLGWGALLIPRDLGFLILAVSFTLVLFIDLRATRRAEAPAWYPKLRWPLTVTVVAILVLGALAQHLIVMPGSIDSRGPSAGDEGLERAVRDVPHSRSPFTTEKPRNGLRSMHPASTNAGLEARVSHCNREISVAGRSRGGSSDHSRAQPAPRSGNMRGESKCQQS